MKTILIPLFLFFCFTAGAQAQSRELVGIPEITSSQLLLNGSGTSALAALPLNAISADQAKLLKSYQAYRLEVALRLDSNQKVAHIRRTGNGSWPVHPSGPAISEGVKYSFVVGQNNFGGTATLVKARGKYHVTIPLQFAGGVLFGRSSPQETKQWMRLRALPPAEYYVKDAASLEQIPALRNRVLAIVAAIEGMYRTPFFELKIVPSFIKDERKILDREELELGRGDTHNYATALMLGLQKLSQRTRKMAIIISPVGDPNAVSPTNWDIFSDPYTSAHEMGHILGIATEGFFFQDYSPVGLMNDAYALAAVRRLAPSQKPRLDITDFNTIMSAIAPFLSPAIPLDRAQREFSANHRTLLKQNRGNYYSFDHARRVTLAEEAVRSWFGLRAN